MVTILMGDCRDVLKTLPDASVNCCVTSPPYWGLRDYGTARWEGGDPGCEHLERVGGTGRSTLGAESGGHAISDAGKLRSIERSFVPAREICRKCGARRVDSQIGLERTLEDYVASLVAVFREVRRVLRDDGTCWINLGDSWASGKGSCFNPGGGESSFKDCRKDAGVIPLKRLNVSEVRAVGLKPKDLVGVPWRVAFALQADGWWLRSDIIWHKPNPMPESVTDRPTKSHEYIFLLAKSESYFYDAEAIKESVAYGDHPRNGCPGPDIQAPGQVKQSGITKRRRQGTKHRKPAGWESGPGSHGVYHRAGRSQSVEYAEDTTNGKRNKRDVWTVPTSPYAGAHFATFPPALILPCILAGCPTGGTVLDPFGGSGTVGEVASGNGRLAVLIELNPEYAKLAQERTGLFCMSNASSSLARKPPPQS
jgi:DNA modification methylase